jgi:hypothetical protein
MVRTTRRKVRSITVKARRHAEQATLAARLAEIGFALPGSLTVTACRCDKQNCRCHGDPSQLHGPYAFWTCKVNNTTVTRMVNPEEVATYQPMLDNARTIRDLVSQLQAPPPASKTEPRTSAMKEITSFPPGFHCT